MGIVDSLILNAVMKLQTSPLCNPLLSTEPSHSVIADYPGKDDQERPELLFRPKKAPVRLEWQAITRDGKAHENDSAFVQKLIDDVNHMHAHLNAHLVQKPDPKTFIAWTEVINRKGFGNYSTAQGGWGTFPDDRIGVIYSLYCKTENSIVMYDLTLYFAIIPLIGDEIATK